MGTGASKKVKLVTMELNHIGMIAFLFPHIYDGHLCFKTFFLLPEGQKESEHLLFFGEK